jgi:flagellar assembly protein FliH
LSLVPSGPPYPDLRDENAALRATIAAQTAAIVEIRRAILAASEPEIVRLACAVAQRVARRELTIDPSLVTDWVREAIGGLDDAEPQTLVVAPDFAQAVDLASLSAAFPSIASVEVDPALSSMRCEIRTRASRIDASLEARLAAVVMDLGVVSP